MVTGIWERTHWHMHAYRYPRLRNYAVTVYTPRNVKITAQRTTAYALMLAEVLEFFRTGISPIESALTIELMVS